MKRGVAAEPLVSDLTSPPLRPMTAIPSVRISQTPLSVELTSRS